MQVIERTPINTEAPVDPVAYTEHLRIDDAMGALRYAFTAAREIEGYANLALLDQEITALADPLTGKVLQLPVGPVALGASVTVELVEQDGSATPITSGWFLQAGPHPKLFFDTIPGGLAKYQKQFIRGAFAKGINVACLSIGMRIPTHPVSRSENIRSAVPDIRSPRDVAAERGFLMSSLVGVFKRFEACDTGAARGAVRAL